MSVIRGEMPVRDTAKTGAAPEKFGGDMRPLFSLFANQLHCFGIAPKAAEQVGVGDHIQRRAINDYARIA